MNVKRALRSSFPAAYRFLGRVKRSFDVAGQREERGRLAAAIAATDAFPATPERRQHGLETPLIVSLTSYPKRFDTLARTVRGLLDQTVRPDHLILWLAPGDRDKLPAEVIALMPHGFEVRDSVDLRSATKLIPSLRAFPDATVVTVDDDLYYEPRWLERLVEASRLYPGEVIGYRGHIARFDRNGAPAPYEDWAYESRATMDPAPGQLLFLTGVSGVLYPPRALHPDVLDGERYLALCPRADDIWFFAMTLRNDTPRRRLDHRLPIVEWPSSQASALNSFNYHESGNDRQLAAVLQHYPDLRARLRHGGADGKGA